LLFRRVLHYFDLKRILEEIKPDIFHIVSALNLFYHTYNSRYKKVIENQGSDLILTPQKYKFFIPFYNHYFKKVDGVIGDSKLLYEKSLLYGATEEKELNKIIEIGIDFNVFNENVQEGVVRKKYNLGNRPIVLHTRGMNKIYNLDIVIASIEKVRLIFPDVIYILPTNMDNLDDSIKVIIEEKNLKNNLLFVGFQNRINDLKYFYRDANVNISVPSSDSSPFSVYESMACMTPNIVTDLPWLYSKFTPDKHLLTCKVRDSEDLGLKIIDILNKNHNIDFNDTYKIVYEQINLQTENSKLESFYRYLLDKKN
jgi:glycosyltransferase involved in cell wall biosynthesis